MLIYQHYDHDVVYDVVTDWSFALAGFLVSTLFGVSANPSNFSRCKYFSSRIPFLFQYNLLVVLMLANLPCYTVFMTGNQRLHFYPRRYSVASIFASWDTLYYAPINAKPHPPPPGTGGQFGGAKDSPPGQYYLTKPLANTPGHDSFTSTIYSLLAIL